MEEKRLALLIDAENTPSKYVDAIISELKNYGVITYQRMYGDFTSSSLADWHKKALKYAIVPIQQPHYSSAKNAADISLVIDAMDILVAHKVDGFCIVTSDSDFTRLVSRIREEGMTVIGMGKSDASKTFIAACNEYKFLDKISGEDEKETTRTRGAESAKAKAASSITPLKDIKAAINNLVQQSENNGEHANLGSTKSNLQRLFPDFDERNYGYSSMRKFIEEATKFQTMQKGTTICILRSLDHEQSTEADVQAFIRSAAADGVLLSSLGQQLAKEYPDFKYRDYGYSQLSRYVASVPGVVEDGIMVRQVGE